MKLSHLALLLLALAAAFLISSCTPAVNPELLGSRWVLQSMPGHSLLESNHITLNWAEGGFNGFSGCNRYYAKTEPHSTSKLEVAEVSHTDMACDPAANQQEADYLAALQAAAQYRLEGDSLSFEDKQGGVVLQFRRLPTYNASAKDLLGQPWKLIEADAIQAGDLSRFTLQFDETTLRGTTPCRSFHGTYRTEGDTHAITTINMGEAVECGKQETFLEGQFTTLLSEVEQFNLSQGRLELYTIQNKRLVFTR